MKIERKGEESASRLSRLRHSRAAETGMSSSAWEQASAKAGGWEREGNSRLHIHTCREDGESSIIIFEKFCTRDRIQVCDVSTHNLTGRPAATPKQEKRA